MTIRNDREALLALLAELEARVLAYDQARIADQTRLAELINAQTALQTGAQQTSAVIVHDPLPIPTKSLITRLFHSEPAPVQLDQWGHPVPSGITRIVDALTPYVPGLWQIRPFCDQLTWRKMLLVVIVLGVAANTSLAKTVTDQVPALKPVINALRLDTYAPNATTEKATCNAQTPDGPPSPPSPQQR